MLQRATAANIPNPIALTTLQYNDGIKYCKLRLVELRKTAQGLQIVYLKNCPIKAQDLKDEDNVKGIKQTVNMDESKIMWHIMPKW